MCIRDRCMSTTQKLRSRHHRSKFPEGQKHDNVKVMLVSFSDYQGIVYHEYTPESQTISKEYYQEVRSPLLCSWCSLMQKTGAVNWQLPHGNAPTHLALKMKNKMNPSFLKMEDTLKGSCFESHEDIMQNTMAQLRTTTKKDFYSCYHQWKDRWTRCVES